MTTYDSLVSKLIAGETVVVEVPHRAALNSLRVGSYKAVQAHIKQWDDLGYLSDSLRDATVSTVVTETRTEALLVTLSLVKRKKRYDFTILSTGPAGEGTPDHEEVSTNLEHNQSSTVQYRSTDSDSQEYGTDTDSGSTEGEEHGQCSAPEDWESQLRAFIESDSDAPHEA